MVQYSPKLTFGPETADWQERLNPDRMRRQRVERMQMLMRKYGIAASLKRITTTSAISRHSKVSPIPCAAMCFSLPSTIR